MIHSGDWDVAFAKNVQDLPFWGLERKFWLYLQVKLSDWISKFRWKGSLSFRMECLKAKIPSEWVDGRGGRGAVHVVWGRFLGGENELKNPSFLLTTSLPPTVAHKENHVWYLTCLVSRLRKPHVMGGKHRLSLATIADNLCVLCCTYLSTWMVYDTQLSIVTRYCRTDIKPTFFPCTVHISLLHLLGSWEEWDMHWYFL